MRWWIPFVLTTAAACDPDPLARTEAIGVSDEIGGMMRASDGGLWVTNSTGYSDRVFAHLDPTGHLGELRGVAADEIEEVNLAGSPDDPLGVVQRFDGTALIQLHTGALLANSQYVRFVAGVGDHLWMMAGASATEYDELDATGAPVRHFKLPDVSGAVAVGDGAYVVTHAAADLHQVRLLRLDAARAVVWERALAFRDDTVKDLQLATLRDGGVLVAVDTKHTISLVRLGADGATQWTRALHAARFDNDATALIGVRAIGEHGGGITVIGGCNDGGFSVTLLADGSEPRLSLVGMFVSWASVEPDRLAIAGHNAAGNLLLFHDTACATAAEPLDDVGGWWPAVTTPATATVIPVSAPFGGDPATAPRPADPFFSTSTARCAAAE